MKRNGRFDENSTSAIYRTITIVLIVLLCLCAIVVALAVTSDGTFFGLKKAKQTTTAVGSEVQGLVVTDGMEAPEMITTDGEEKSSVIDKAVVAQRDEKPIETEKMTEAETPTEVPSETEALTEAETPSEAKTSTETETETPLEAKAEEETENVTEEAEVETEAAEEPSLVAADEEKEPLVAADEKQDQSPVAVNTAEELAAMVDVEETEEITDAAPVRSAFPMPTKENPTEQAAVDDEKEPTKLVEPAEEQAESEEQTTPEEQTEEQKIFALKETETEDKPAEITRAFAMPTIEEQEETPAADETEEMAVADEEKQFEEETTTAPILPLIEAAPTTTANEEQEEPTTEEPTLPSIEEVPTTIASEELEEPTTTGSLLTPRGTETTADTVTTELEETEATEPEEIEIKAEETEETESEETETEVEEAETADSETVELETDEEVETDDSEETTVLTIGSEGDDVIKMQEALLELGFLEEDTDDNTEQPDETDADTEQSEEADVEVEQTDEFEVAETELSGAMELETGTFGALTEIAVKEFQMFAGLEITGEADPETCDEIYKKEVKFSNLGRDDNGILVEILQTLLKDLGYQIGEIDGSYGPQTEQAVWDFQRVNGLTQDGAFGKETADALFGNPLPYDQLMLENVDNDN